MKEKLIEFLANIPMTSWNVRGIAELLIKDGWIKADAAKDFVGEIVYWQERCCDAEVEICKRCRNSRNALSAVSINTHNASPCNSCKWNNKS